MKIDNNKQTAVEWLVEELRKYGSPIPINLENQAKVMEQEQKKESYNDGYANGQMDLITQ